MGGPAGGPGRPAARGRPTSTSIGSPHSPANTRTAGPGTALPDRELRHHAAKAPWADLAREAATRLHAPAVPS
jgi:hypothetical protein